MIYPSDDEHALDRILPQLIICSLPNLTELIILALLADDSLEKRIKGVQLIKRYRNNNPWKPGQPVRMFKKYSQEQLNLLATDYSDFPNYDDIEITEPPCTFALSIEELEDIANGKIKVFFFISQKNLIIIITFFFVKQKIKASTIPIIFLSHFTKKLINYAAIILTPDFK